ncbi:Bug family tripartite tricarboxylate transporter substrate binding protein [Paracraurococcus lichenis]|uniref:Tripartite tricarboxylate transporter substrate binding protein n=1 Tax=Paracraurococcus lichenis TaxID=3064888 RepID=A0ABT9DV83_9PROT|nr:tripartite tricarboxylate transporter substrate binding protein [Paracraurococcus sp. LOR1-02]MDO9707816.1 tripartite tricarboxylate transporter substrate binding protein [Paracraurococcus sp. LOR1-02]
MPQCLGRRALLAAAGASGLSRRALAQPEGWPARPVRIVVPFTPGGSNDAIARPLAERLQARFGQPFVIENRPGAGSAVGVAAVAQGAPDGHTLLLTTSSIAAIGPVQGTGFDPTKELDGVALLAKAPLIVLTPPGSPIASIRDLVAADRARPGTLHYASSGPGSTTHIASELFNLRAGTRLQHVPYRGTAGALTDLVAGRVEVMFTTIASAAGQIRGGLLRIIAYTGDERPAGTPPAPTVRDAGIGYESGIWWGLFAPHGLPPGLRRTLNEAANGALAEPGFARFLEGEGAMPAPLPPERFDEFLAAEVRSMREVVAAARIRAD